MKIHVIDDNNDMTDMLKTYFTKKGHECSTSNDGRNALAILQTQKFDVILLDIAMPEFSGTDIVETLSKNDKMRNLNIVALTASSVSSDNEEHLKKMGVHSVLKKPMDPDKLLDYLQQFDRKAIYQ